VQWSSTRGAVVCLYSGRIAEFASAEGPVLLWHVDEVDRDVIAANTSTGEVFGDPRVQRPFDVDRSSSIEEDLSDSAFSNASNAKSGCHRCATARTAVIQPPQSR
jgi:hypothetical protein